MADNAEFNEWLKNQGNLTDEEKKALTEHSQKEAFSEDAFNKYLADFRVQTAVSAAKGDLSKLDAEQILGNWKALASQNKGSEQTPEIAQAMLNMAKFSEQLVTQADQKISDKTLTWSMDNAPKVDAWLDINIQRQRDPQKQKRNAAMKESINGFYNAFDQEHGLTGLNKESAQMLAANEAAVLAIGKDFDPFAKNDKGELLHPEFEAVDNFYNKLEIDNSDKNKDDKNVDKEAFKKEMAELAYNEAVLRLSMNPDFARMDADQQKKMLADLYAQNMTEGMITLIAAQMAENAAKQGQQDAKDGKKIDPEQFKEQAAEHFKQVVNAKNVSFKVSSTAALSAVATCSTAYGHVARRVAQKTGHKSFRQKIKDFDKKMAKKYPKAYPMLKNMAISAGIGMATGGAGLAVWSAYKTLKTVQKSRQAFKAANANGQYKGYFDYLKKNPKEIVTLGVSIAGTALSVYMVGLDGINVNDFGLSGQVGKNIMDNGLSAGLSNTWDGVKGMFTPSDAAQNISWTDKAAAMGKGFVNKVNPMNWDGTRWARMGLSLGGGLTTGAVDYIASFKEKDPEKRKQLRKNAWKAATGAFIGSAVGLTVAGAMGAHAAHENAVDEHTGASEHVPNGGAQGTENNTSTTEYVEDPKNLEFWQDRSTKFLGEENVKHIYDMVEKGDIKLPEGIETKEEYAYKLAMDIQQTPAEINEALGGEWKSSAKLTSEIQSWKAEDFAKLNDSIDDFSDRGYHNGVIPEKTHIRSGGGHGGSNGGTPAPEETVVVTPVDEKQPEEKTDTPVDNNEQTETYDPTRYQREQEATDNIKPDVIAAAEKKEDVVEAVWDGIKTQEDAGLVTTEEGTAAGNVVLDQADKNHDGTIDEKESSAKNMNKAFNKADKILEAKDRTNPDEAVATQMEEQDYIKEDVTPANTYCVDTNDPKFLQGAAKFCQHLKHHDTSVAELKATTENGLEKGIISSKQLTMINNGLTRVIQDNPGIKYDRAFDLLTKEFNEAAKFNVSQENAQTAEWNRSNFEKTESNANAGTSNSATNTSDHANEGAASTGTDNGTKPNDSNSVTAQANNTNEGAGTDNDKKDPATPQSASERIDAIIEAQATVTLADADKLQPRSFHMEEDKLGNMQFIIKDEAGHTVKLTQVDKLPNGQVVGDNWKIEMPKDHPDYLKLHPEENPNLSGADRISARINTGFQSEDIVKIYLRDIHDGKFTETKDLSENASGQSEAKMRADAAAARIHDKKDAQNLAHTDAQKDAPNQGPSKAQMEELKKGKGPVAENFVNNFYTQKNQNTQ